MTIFVLNEGIRDSREMPARPLANEESRRSPSCKPEGLCFNHCEQNLTLLTFYIVYVYDRATVR
jgi:hypothetical protein